MLRARRIALILMAAASIGTACGDDPTSSGDIASAGELLPFEQIQASEFTFEADPNRGILRVETTEPASCAREIAAVEFLTRSMLDGTAITEMFTIRVDGGEPPGPFPAGNVAMPNPTEVELTGREVRFGVDTSTGGDVGAVEIRVLAPA